MSPYQETGRIGHLEHRFRLPLNAAIRADVLTAPPDATLEEIVFDNMLLTRHTVCVVDETSYEGIVSTASDTCPATSGRRSPWPRSPTTTSRAPAPAGAS